VSDAAVKIQDERLRYIRDHRQDTLLRSESAQQLRELIARESEKVGKGVGRICILPVDFPGSEKLMHQQYLDAMAIVTTYSKPEYFITFAASGQWRSRRLRLLEDMQVSRPCRTIAQTS